LGKSSSIIKMSPYKFIVFDFDGTIADSRSLFIELYNELALKHDYSLLNDENLDVLRGVSISERCRLLGVPMYRIPFLASAIIKKYKASISRLHFNEGMKELLLSLGSNHIPCAVLSSNSKENIQKFFDLNGMANSDIFSSRSVFGKHRLINKFLKQKKLKPAEILYVGDELRDVIACRKSDVNVAWVSWGYDSEESLNNNKPDYHIDSPAQILSLVLHKPVVAV
jgi:phosphoglycolate phosphatase